MPGIKEQTGLQYDMVSRGEAEDGAEAAMKPAPGAGSLTSSRAGLPAIIDDFGAMVEKRPEPVAVALMLLYAVVVAMNNQRPLWYDELTTNMPALVGGFDWDLRLGVQHGLLPALLAKISVAIFGRGNWALRLPATLGYLGASACIYTLLRRLRTGNLFALFAVLIFWSTPSFDYAAEARPYGLILGLGAGLLLAWQRAVTEERRAWSLAAIALSELCLIFCHPLAILAAMPILFAEAARLRSRRKADWPLWICAGYPALGVVPIFLVHPVHPAYSPLLNGQLSNGIIFYLGILQSVAPAVMFAALAALLTIKPPAEAGLEERGEAPSQWKLSPAFFALMAGGLAIPFVVNAVLALTLTNPYYPRYSIPGTLPVPIIAALILARRTGRSARAGVIALGAAFAFFLLGEMQRQHPEVWHAPPVATSLQVESRKDLPFVAASGLTFTEMAEREPASFLSRVYYLRDPEGAVRYAHSGLFETKDFVEYMGFLPKKGIVTPYADFIRTHRKFLVYGTVSYWEDWLLRRLMAEGAQLVWLGQVRGSYKDVDLYEVTLAPESGMQGGEGTK